MPRISFAFYATACVFVLAGMVMGIWMGMNHNFTLSPVHAHLNLIGWASMAIMGTFFALAGDRAPRRLGWVSYVLMTGGMAIMAPSLAGQLLGDLRFAPGVAISSLAIFAGALFFFAAVLVTWARSRNTASSKPLAGLGATLPAE